MIRMLEGDATRPVGEGSKIVAHVVNDVGGWGAGFVLAVSRRWPLAEERYRSWHAGSDASPFALGRTQFVPVGEGVVVANMIAQTGYGAARLPHRGTSFGRPPIRYSALTLCLRRVAEEARLLGASVHAPRIGCGLAGGTWEKVLPILRRELDGLEVFVYDLPKAR